MSEPDRWADEVFKAFKAYLDEKIDFSDAELRRFEIEAFAKINERIDALEQAPFEYVGTFDAAKTYKRNQFTTFAGSVWHCRCAETKQRPGDGGDWVLAVKRGRDGDDRR